MKKFIILICAVVSILSCHSGGMTPPAALPPIIISITSGEYFNGYDISSIRMFGNFSDVLYINSKDWKFRTDDYNSRPTVAAGYWSRPGGRQFSEFPSEGNPWVAEHFRYFEKIDVHELLQKKPDYIEFWYLKVKSLKFYSINKEVCGRKVGEDLSDLFYFRNIRLYSYPDCSFSVSCYEAAPEKVTFDKLVEYNLMPEGRFILYPIFEHDPRSWLDDVTFRLEITTEDEARGEMSFVSESSVMCEYPEYGRADPLWWTIFN